MKQQIKQLTGRDVYVSEYEDIRKSDLVNSAGRVAYVERNYAIIMLSDYCVFYCEPNCYPSKRKNLKRDVIEHQEKSGTMLAFDYACKRKNVGTLVALFNLMG